MKRLGLYIVLAGVIFGCKDTWEHPWPDIPAEPQEVHPKIEHPPISFPVSETKEPYFELQDAGFEALLIILSIDSDNQINGKVSREDLTKLKEFTHTSPVYPFHPIVKKQKTEFLERNYGVIPSIVSFDDIRYMENIKTLEVHAGKSIDLSHNTSLERISWINPTFDTLDLRGLQNLKHMEFISQYYYGEGSKNTGEVLLGSNSSLEVFKYWGVTTQIDLTSAVNLKTLYLQATQYSEPVLDLSKNVNLEEVSIYVGNSLNPIKVLISPESRARMDRQPDKWKKYEKLEWVVKE